MTPSAVTAASQAPVAQTAATSQAEQDYIKAILGLEMAGERAATSTLAGRLHVSPASVTSMLQQLAGKELIVYVPYQGARLTDTGRALGLEMLRHHRIVELYLQKALGFSWDEVHAEADRLEHVISERLEERLDAALGHPSTDPHGDPIPSRDGRLPVPRGKRLAQLRLGARSRVTRITSQQPETLRHLASLGIVPGADITVWARAADGTISAGVGDHEWEIAAALAQAIYVTTQSDPSASDLTAIDQLMPNERPRQ